MPTKCTATFRLPAFLREAMRAPRLATPRQMRFLRRTIGQLGTQCVTNKTAGRFTEACLRQWKPNAQHRTTQLHVDLMVREGWLYKHPEGGWAIIDFSLNNLDPRRHDDWRERHRLGRRHYVFSGPHHAKTAQESCNNRARNVQGELLPKTAIRPDNKANSRNASAHGYGYGSGKEKEKQNHVFLPLARPSSAAERGPTEKLPAPELSTKEVDAIGQDLAALGTKPQTVVKDASEAQPAAKSKPPATSPPQRPKYRPDGSPPTEGELWDALRRIGEQDTPIERFDQLRQELNRCGITAKELWGAAQAQRALADPPTNPVAFLFATLRARRDAAAAKAGCISPLPDVRRVARFPAHLRKTEEDYHFKALVDRIAIGDLNALPARGDRPTVVTLGPDASLRWPQAALAARLRPQETER